MKILFTVINKKMMNTLKKWKFNLNKINDLEVKKKKFTIFEKKLKLKERAF